MKNKIIVLSNSKVLNSCVCDFFSSQKMTDMQICLLDVAYNTTLAKPKKEMGLIKNGNVFSTLTSLADESYNYVITCQGLYKKITSLRLWYLPASNPDWEVVYPAWRRALEISWTCGPPSCACRPPVRRPPVPPAAAAAAAAGAPAAAASGAAAPRSAAAVVAAAAPAEGAEGGRHPAPPPLRGASRDPRSAGRTGTGSRRSSLKQSSGGQHQLS